MPELSPLHHPLYQLQRTPFHARTSELCLPHNWRRWAGCLAAGSYDLGLDREYWAIRNHAALIDVSLRIKYRSEGPDAARLLHRVTPRDIHKRGVSMITSKMLGSFRSDARTRNEFLTFIDIRDRR